MFQAPTFPTKIACIPIPGVRKADIMMVWSVDDVRKLPEKYAWSGQFSMEYTSRKDMEMFRLESRHTKS